MNNQPDINSLWDYDNPAETEARFRALLPAAETDPAYQAELLTQIARCLRSLGRVEEALLIQQALQAEFEAEEESDGYVFEELGECYLLFNQPHKAQPHFAAAYAILSKDMWLKAEEPDRLTRLKDLGTA